MGLQNRLHMSQLNYCRHISGIGQYKYYTWHHKRNYSVGKLSLFVESG